jgi:acetyltransferase-like isoleucine patch superfamily enzyme
MTILQRYGFWGTAELMWFKARTLLKVPGARLIRFPFDIRGKQFIRLGKGLTTGRYCRIEAHPESPASGPIVIIGEGVEMNDSVHIAGSRRVEIGNNVLLASKIFITDLNHGNYGDEGEHDHPDTPPGKRSLSARPVVIEDNVWIGESVSVLPGVTIGKGSIIGTMSVVTKSIPPYSIAVGIPAKVIKRFNFQSSRWERVE